MIFILEQLLVAMTDAQFDRVLAMISELFNALGSGVRAVWEILSPLLIGVVSIQIAYYQSKASAARKAITEQLRQESAIAQLDRTKILTDLELNTKISEEAFTAANGHNEKIAAVVKLVESKKQPT